MQLLLTAADVYGEQGLDGATTRKIAQASGQILPQFLIILAQRRSLLSGSSAYRKTIRDDFHDVFKQLTTF